MEPLNPFLSFVKFAAEMGEAAGTRVAAAWRRGRPEKTQLVKVTRPASAGSGIRSTPTPTPAPQITPRDYAGYNPAEALHQERKDILREKSRLESLRVMVRPEDTAPIDRDLAYQDQLLADVDARIKHARAETEQVIRDCETNLQMLEEHDPRYAETEEALEAAQQELADLDNYTIGSR